MPRKKLSYSYLPSLFATVLLTVSSQSIAKLTCDTTSPLKAQYTVTEYTDNKLVGSYPLTIYRNSTTVIYEYPKTGIADVWRLEMKNHLGLSRYFYKQKRAIDFDSSDLKNIGYKNKWKKLYNILDVSERKIYDKVEAGCLSIDGYDDNYSKVFFLKKYGIPQSIYAKNGKNLTKTYKLNKLQMSNEIENMLSAFETYNALDFADIGDNEADPFISQMINLGFIEHAKGSHNHTSSATSVKLPRK